MAVLLGAAGLFLSLSSIRDHKAYHDGSVYIYQLNTEQKTQTRLCVRLSTPLKLKGVLHWEDIICYTKGTECVLCGIDQPLGYKVHKKIHTVTFWALDLVELILFIIIFRAAIITMSPFHPSEHAIYYLHLWFSCYDVKTPAMIKVHCC